MKGKKDFTEVFVIHIHLFQLCSYSKYNINKNNKIVKVWYDMDRLKKRLKSYEINYSSDQCQRVMCPWMEWLLKISESSNGENNRLL